MKRLLILLGALAFAAVLVGCGMQQRGTIFDSRQTSVPSASPTPMKVTVSTNTPQPTAPMLTPTRPLPSPTTVIATPTSEPTLTTIVQKNCADYEGKEIAYTANMYALVSGGKIVKSSTKDFTLFSSKKVTIVGKTFTQDGWLFCQTSYSGTYPTLVRWDEMP